MPEQLEAPATCKGGCAEVVITPPLGVSMAGYFHDRKAESVRDDLFAKAIVLEHASRRLVLVSCDLICIDQDSADKAKALINAKLGIPSQDIMICATHTHTGPETRKSGHIPIHTAWRDALPGKIAEAAAQAAGSLKTVSLRAGSGWAEGYAYNRLFRLKDGSEVFGKGRGGDQIMGTAGPVDPEVQTLSLVDEDENLIAMAVNFALHVDVIGGGRAKAISADWPGVLARSIAAVHGRDVVTLVMQGTCGDINHVVHDPTNLPRGGPERAELIGRGLAGVALHASGLAEPMTHIELDSKVRVLAIPYYTRDEAFRAEMQKLRDKPKRSAKDDYILQRGETWPHDGQIADVPVQTMRIGEMGLIALPAEVFVRLGLQAKHYSPAERTFVVELANARSSTYVPTTDQADRGAYGAKPVLSRWLCADAGSRMIDASLNMLHDMWS